VVVNNSNNINKTNNYRSPQTTEHKKIRPRHMALEIEALIWDRYKTSGGVTCFASIFKQMYLLVIYTELHPIQRASCSFNSPPRNKRTPFPMDCNLLPMRKVGPMSIIWHSLGDQLLITVHSQTVYKGHSREPKNVTFMSSCTLYTA
jgi:hypothetical protein